MRLKVPSDGAIETALFGFTIAVTQSVEMRIHRICIKTLWEICYFYRPIVIVDIEKCGVKFNTEKFSMADNFDN